MMRVWRINDDLYIAGETLLKATRAASRDMGYGFREMVETIDGDQFREITDWQSMPLYDPEQPDALDLTLGQTLSAPGLAVASADWL